MSRHEIVGTIKDWTFYEVTNHGFTGELADRPLYGFTVGTVATPKGTPKMGELYLTVEHVMVAAVGHKYTGPRGAGGTGVGTAADWFMKMIGADRLVPVENSRLVLTGAAEVAGMSGSGSALAAMDKALQDEGYTLARVNH